MTTPKDHSANGTENAARAPRTPRAPLGMGFVTADAVYTLGEIQGRLGLGDWALRQARRDGLKVIYFGRQGFIRGKDLIRYFDRLAGDAS